MSSTTKDYRADIDGLRALAVMAVLLFHAFPTVLPGGYVGVDVFFVISGYLISRHLVGDLERGRFSIGDFYARRIRRIFPALALMLAVVLVAGWKLLLVDQYRDLGAHVAAGAGFVSNLYLWHQVDYFDVAAELKPLLHLWSLGIEEQFYFFWPLLLALFFRFRITKIGVGTTILLSLATTLVLVNSNPSATFYSPWTRTWELAIGAWLAISHKRLFARIPGQVASALGLLLLALGFGLIHQSTPFPSAWALLPTLGTVLVIDAGSKSWLNQHLWSSRPLVAIGLISYPLYLWHWPLLSLQALVAGEATPLIRSGLLLLSVVLATLTYQFVEKPIRRSSNKRKTITGLAVAMSLVFFAGISVWWSEGFPQRIPAQVRDWATLDWKDVNWESRVRSGGCHLYDPQKTEHPQNCIESTRPLLFLWGDSYAAALYPGLHAEQSRRNFGIAQFTSSACPPIFDIQYRGFRENCDEVNENVLKNLAKAQPDVLLLQTTWHPADYNLTDEIYWKKFEDSLQRMRAAAPRARIMLAGPVPRWKFSNANCVVQDYLLSGRLPDDRMKTCLKSFSNSLDEPVRLVAQRSRVEFVSLRDQFCNQEGCLWRVGSKKEELATIDGGHLTPAASEFVVSRVFDRIFQF